MTIASVKAVVAIHYNVSISVMEGHERWSDYVWPRHVAWYLCREVLGKSNAQIGRLFGNRDASTIQHGIDRLKKRLEIDEFLRGRVANLIVLVTADQLRATPDALETEAQAA